MTYVNKSKTWEGFTTPDGRWTYGYGEYNRKLTDALDWPKTQNVTSSTMSSIPGAVQVAHAVTAAVDAVGKYALSVASPDVPTYYIWAKYVATGASSGEKLRVVFEIPYDRVTRDTIFDQFVPYFIKNQNDGSRVSLISGYKAATVPFTLAGLAKIIATSTSVNLKSAAGGDAPSDVNPATKTWIVLGVVALGALAYLLYSRR